MKWTLQKPTEKGYYCVWTLTKEGELDELECLYANPAVNHPRADHNMKVGLWYGPIVPPPDPETFLRKPKVTDYSVGFGGAPCGEPVDR